MGNLITNCTAMFCLGSSFGTHHGVKNTHFNDCHSSWGAGAGFGDRGVDSTYTACTSSYDQVGLQFFVESAYIGSSIASGLKWIGGAIVNPVGRAVAAYDGATRLFLSGGVVEFTEESDSDQAVFYFDRAVEASVDGLTMRVGASIASRPAIFQLSGATIDRLRVTGLLADFRGGFSLNGKPFIDVVSGNAIAIYADRITCISTDNHFGCFVKASNLASSSEFGLINFSSLGAIQDGVTVATLGAMVRGPFTLGPGQTYQASAIVRNLGFGGADALTISGGAITVGAKTYYRVDTEGSAASDDLATINGVEDGKLLILRSSSSGRDVTVKHGTGNILLANGDFELNTTNARLVLLGFTTNWIEIARSAPL